VQYDNLGTCRQTNFLNIMVPKVYYVAIQHKVFKQSDFMYEWEWLWL